MFPLLSYVNSISFCFVLFLGTEVEKSAAGGDAQSASEDSEKIEEITEKLTETEDSEKIEENTEKLTETEDSEKIEEITEKLTETAVE